MKDAWSRTEISTNLQFEVFTVLTQRECQVQGRNYISVVVQAIIFMAANQRD